VTQKRLEIVELGGRIHIGQQPFAVAKPIDGLSLDHVHPYILKEFQHLEPAFCHSPDDGHLAGAGVDRAQRMISAFGARDDGVCVPGLGEEMDEKRRGHKRHVARHHDEMVVAGRRQGRVEAAERPAVRHSIGHNADIAHAVNRIATHQQDVIGYLPELRQLAIENRATADQQSAFVASAKPAGPTTRENCGTRHSFSILPPV
jgi:hypothetical protein